MFVLPPQEQALFPCLWRQGMDDWGPYCELYLEQVWERYVRPLGAANTKAKERREVQQTPATAAPAAAGGKAGGGAGRRVSCWGKAGRSGAAAGGSGGGASSGSGGAARQVSRVTSLERAVAVMEG